MASSWGYAAVGDDDSTCGVVAIQMRFIAPGPTFQLEFRRRLDPVAGAYYYTNGNGNVAGSWRACSYGEAGLPQNHCNESQTSWEFGAWRDETSPTVFS